MTAPVCERSATKKAVNLSINSDLLRQARDRKLNLSRLLEQQLESILRQERAQRWKEENRAGIDAYNRFVEEHGVFGEPPA